MKPETPEEKARKEQVREMTRRFMEELRNRARVGHNVVYDREHELQRARMRGVR